MKLMFAPLFQDVRRISASHIRRMLHADIRLISALHRDKNLDACPAVI